MRIELQTMTYDSEPVWTKDLRLKVRSAAAAEFDGGDKDCAERILGEKFYNPDVDRLVAAKDGNLFLNTLLVYTGNAYYRWVLLPEEPSV